MIIMLLEPFILFILKIKLYGVICSRNCLYIIIYILILLYTFNVIQKYYNKEIYKDTQ